MPLWDMRWEALRPIQVDAIRLLLTTQQDVLISARTASGKTEAAFLPILSRLFEAARWTPIGAMYVGPLKATDQRPVPTIWRTCVLARKSLYIDGTVTWTPERRTSSCSSQRGFS